MDPMTPFAHWGYRAPYIAEPPEFNPRAVVMPVRCKTGLITAARGSVAHLEAGVAVIIEDGLARFGGRFLCGGGSNNIAILANTDEHGGVCVGCQDAADGPSLYRCFDRFGQLLYIGSTGRYQVRIKTHESQTPWWHEVADIKVQRFPTLFQARAAERLAINAEDPARNIVHRTKRRSA